MLLGAGANVNAKNKNIPSETALQAACCLGNKSIVRILLDRGADINAEVIEVHHMNAFRVASFRGCYGIVKMLLDRGADVNDSKAKRNCFADSFV